MRCEGSNRGYSLDLSRLGLTSEAVSKLRFDHRERRFDVRPLVICLEKRFLIELVVVKHPPPKVGLFLHVVSLIASSLLAVYWLRRVIHFEGK